MVSGSWRQSSPWYRCFTCLHPFARRVPQGNPACRLGAGVRLRALAVCVGRRPGWGRPRSPAGARARDRRDSTGHPASIRGRPLLQRDQAAAQVLHLGPLCRGQAQRADHVVLRRRTEGRARQLEPALAVEDVTGESLLLQQQPERDQPDGEDVKLEVITTSTVAVGRQDSRVYLIVEARCHGGARMIGAQCFPLIGHQVPVHTCTAKVN
mmetsp:Transcript_66159/g.186299  ORF Transcript_66159/g.186299 Transcript_66159/m.186299 type:complete len:210 (-) Transcript_66159:631-1260(-)